MRVAMATNDTMYRLSRWATKRVLPGGTLEVDSRSRSEYRPASGLELFADPLEEPLVLASAGGGVCLGAVPGVGRRARERVGCGAQRQCAARGRGEPQHMRHLLVRGWVGGCIHVHPQQTYGGRGWAWRGGGLPLTGGGVALLHLGDAGRVVQTAALHTYSTTGPG